MSDLLATWLTNLPTEQPKDRWNVRYGSYDVRSLRNVLNWKETRQAGRISFFTRSLIFVNIFIWDDPYIHLQIHASHHRITPWNIVGG